MNCFKIKQLFTLILFSCFIGFLSAQQIDLLEKVRQDRIHIDALHKKKIDAYLTQPAAARSKQIVHPSFLLVDINENGIPIYKAPLNSGAALTTDVTSLQNQSLGLNLQGENMVVGVWDDGVVKDHIELGNRVLSKEGSSEQTHATHVTGTIIATGINSAAKGMAPKASATTWDFENDVGEMASLAKSDQRSLLFSNHSYGSVTGWTKVNGVWRWTGDPTISNEEDFRHGFYGIEAQSIDQLAYLAPYYTIVWAAGNDRIEVGDGTHPPDGNGGTGYDCIIPEAVAKNIITVGAINKVSTYFGASSAVMSSFSSWGPTDDGRIKPDVVGAGVNLFSLSAGGTNQYTTASGTSMATPNVTGSLMLLQELYSKLHGGNFMKASTLKGLAIHTTKEAGAFDGPDYNYGWGLLDVATAAKVLIQEDNENTFVKELSLTSGQSYAIDLYAQANQKITVTICWTDPQGTPVSYSLDPTNKMLVNDLDVRIVDASNNTQFPWILNPNTPSGKATTGDNTRDNVEKIEFNNPSGIKYTVIVNHKGNLVNGKQDFSMIITHKSSLTSGNTYYWVGNSGNWSDAAHWSLNTGGIAANVIPTQLDNVIFDENSFDGIQPSTVSLANDATCKKITWLTDKTSSIALNGHRLKMTSGLSIDAKNFKVSSGGVLHFENATNINQSINILKGDISRSSMEFNGGNWTVYGNLIINKAEILKGSLLLKNKYNSIHELNAAANTALNISGVSIDSVQKSFIDETVSLTTTNSKLNILSPLVLSWNKINYNGTLVLSKGTQVEITGSNTFDSISADKSTMLKLTSGTVQNLSYLALSSAVGEDITLRSTGGKATINFITHSKNCFDFLHVDNVDITGNAVVNAGSNSLVINSNNWLQRPCETILYSNFNVKYTCLNSLTTFEDKSQGNIKSWSWNFGDEESSDNISTKQNAFHKFSKSGTFIVSLVVSDGISDQSFSREVTISSLALPDNDIVLNGNSLLSFQNSEAYQWFKNGEPIINAMARSYQFNGEIGTFFVVTNVKGCNNVSSPFIVTGIEDPNLSIQISPNPARDYIKLKTNFIPDHLTLSNALGQRIVEQNILERDILLDVNNFNDGIYLLQIRSATMTLQRKIIIQR